MNQDGQINFTLGLEDSEFQRNAEADARVMEKIGDEAVKAGKVIDNTFKTEAMSARELSKVIETQSGVVNKLREAYERAKEQADKAFGGDPKKYANLVSAQEELRKEYDEETEALKRLEAQRERMNTSDDREQGLRQQLRMLTQEIATATLKYREMSDQERASAAGREMKRKIEELTKKAGVLRDSMDDANRSIRGLASDTGKLDAFTGGLNVITSTAGAAQGALSILGVKQNDLIDIQTKLQASLAISNALTVIQNNLQKESALILGVRRLQEAATTTAINIRTAAEGRGVIVTTAATVAQKAFNLVANANPYVLLATGAIALVAGLSGFISKTKEATKLHEQQKKEAEKQRKAIEEMNKAIGQSTGNMEAKYHALQLQWNKLRTDSEKNKWIKDNSKAFNDLGLSVKNLTDAEDVLVKMSPQVVAALKAVAEADAYSDLLKESIKKRAVEWENRTRSTKTGDFYTTYKAGDALSDAEARAAGVRTDSERTTTQTLSGMGAHTVVNNLTPEEIDKVNQYRRQQAVKTREEMKSIYDKEVDDYTKKWSAAYDKAVEAQKQIPARLRSGNNNTGGSTDPTKQAEELYRQKRDEERRLRDLEFASQQAIIDAMADGTDKQLEQAKLDFEKRMEELKRGYDDLTDEKIERERKLYETQHPNGRFTYNRNDAKFAPTDAETSLYNQQTQNARIDYLRKLDSLTGGYASRQQERANKIIELQTVVNSITKMLNDEKEKGLKSDEKTIQLLEERLGVVREILAVTTEANEDQIEYYRNYGTIAEKKAATEQYYDNKIRTATDEWQRRTLQDQKSSELANLDAQSRSANIDWSETFNGIGNVLQDVAKSVLKELDDYRKTDDYKNLRPSDKEAYSNLRAQLVSAGGTDAISPFNVSAWSNIGKLANEYKASVKTFLEANREHESAVRERVQAEKEVNAAVSDEAKARAKARLEEAQKREAETGKALQTATDDKDNKRQGLQTATDGATQGLQNFSTVLGQVTSGTLSGFAVGMGNLINSLTGKGDKAASTLGELGGKAAGIVGAILQIMDALGGEPTQFIDDTLNKVATVLEAVLSQLPQIIGSVFKDAGSIITGAISGVTGIFGIKLFSNGNIDEMNKQLDKLATQSAVLADVMGELKNTIQNGTLVESEDAYERAKRVNEQQQAVEQAKIDTELGKWERGSHSVRYLLNDDGGFIDMLRQAGSVLGKSITDVNGLIYTSAEDLKRLEMEAPELYAQILNRIRDTENKHTGSGISDMIAEYINSYAGALDEIEDLWNEKLTGTTLKDIQSQFQSFLSDITKSTEDAANDIEGKLRDAVINGLMNNTYNDKLKKWYEKLTSYIKGDKELSATEAADLRDEYMSITSDAIARRNVIFEKLGIDEDVAQQQTGISKASSTMTQELGLDIRGRLTAVQILQEAANQKLTIVADDSHSIRMSAAAVAQGMSQMVELQGVAVSHLAQIEANTNYLPQMNNTLNKIDKNTQNL